MSPPGLLTPPIFGILRSFSISLVIVSRGLQCINELLQSMSCRSFGLNSPFRSNQDNLAYYQFQTFAMYSQPIDKYKLQIFLCCHIWIWTATLKSCTSQWIQRSVSLRINRSNILQVQVYTLYPDLVRYLLPIWYCEQSLLIASIICQLQIKKTNNSYVILTRHVAKIAQGPNLFDGIFPCLM